MVPTGQLRDISMTDYSPSEMMIATTARALAGMKTVFVGDLNALLGSDGGDVNDVRYHALNDDVQIATAHHRRRMNATASRQQCCPASDLTISLTECGLA